MAFKPIDPKRDEFRRYLERSGIIESLTKTFIRLAKERPENPMDYLRRNLGDAVQQADYTDYLNTELADARAEVTRLRDIISSIDPSALEALPETGEKRNSLEQNGLATEPAEVAAADAGAPVDAEITAPVEQLPQRGGAVDEAEVEEQPTTAGSGDMAAEVVAADAAAAAAVEHQKQHVPAVAIASASE